MVDVLTLFIAVETPLCPSSLCLQEFAAKERGWKRMQTDWCRTTVTCQQSQHPQSSTAVCFLEAPGKRMVLKENKAGLGVFPTSFFWTREQHHDRNHKGTCLSLRKVVKPQSSGRFSASSGQDECMVRLYLGEANWWMMASASFNIFIKRNNSRCE